MRELAQGDKYKTEGIFTSYGENNFKAILLRSDDELSFHGAFPHRYFSGHGKACYVFKVETGLFAGSYIGIYTKLEFDRLRRIENGF